MTIVPEPTGCMPLTLQAPTPYHRWDWGTRTFLPDLSAAQLAARHAVDDLRAAKSYATIDYAGANFDADTLSRERISGTLLRLLRGDGLPTGWVGWRDADNEMRWTTATEAQVLQHLRNLSAAIENREQYLLIKAWTKKAQVEALPSVEAVVAYDVQAGW